MDDLLSWDGAEPLKTHCRPRISPLFRLVSRISPPSAIRAASLPRDGGVWPDGLAWTGSVRDTVKVFIFLFSLVYLHLYTLCYLCRWCRFKCFAASIGLISLRGCVRKSDISKWNDPQKKNSGPFQASPAFYCWNSGVQVLWGPLI